MKRYNKARQTAFNIPLSLGGESLFSSILIMLSIILMAISAFRPNSFDSTRGLVSEALAPVITIVSLPFYYISIFFRDVSSFAQLQAENLRLEQENMRLREWYQTALLLNSENKSLRDLLGLELDTKYSYISSRIISDSGNTYVKSLLVHVGTNDGVEKGAAVVSGDGLVGRIIEVSKTTSRVLLATDINLRVPVVVSDTGQNAIMAGTNKKFPKLVHLPKGSEILSGARLITSGYGDVYPHGIPVGKVIIDDNNVMRVALFSDFDTIQIIRILQKSDSLKIDN